MLPFPVHKSESEGEKKASTEQYSQRLQCCDSDTHVSIQSPQDGFHN